MLSLKNLPRKNLQGYAGRTAALLLFSMLMAAAVFGGSMIVGGVLRGLSEAEARLGADIVVTPAEANSRFDAQTVLLQAEPGYFYMDKGKLSEVAAVEGVERATPQRYMASAKAGCCSMRLQMIAFDPETDFVIGPWLKDSSLSEMGLMDVVIGSNVTVYNDNVIQFYDRECRIIGQFEPTGTTLDNCVYMNFETVNELINASFEKRLNLYERYNPEDVISSVMVRTASGYDTERVAADIRARVSGVSVATAKNMVSGISDGLKRISRSITLTAVMLWLIGLFAVMLIFVMMIHERKREFAALSAMGADRKVISDIVGKEAMTVCLAGGAAGIFLSAVLLYSFGGFIGHSLGAGMVVPSPVTAMLLAGLSLGSSLIAAKAASMAAVRYICKTDAGLVLKEGE